MSDEEISRPQSTDFIRTIINEHNADGKFGGRVHTRFPPEPNGYLHIGHAKSICLNFGLAREVRRQVQPALRRHQSRPRKRSSTSIRSWRTSAGWASSGASLYYASDYFEQLYEWAVQLIKHGKAYVCDLTADQMREASRHAHRAGQEQPLPQPLGRGEPRSVRPHEGRRVSRRLAHLAGQDRHGLAQPQHARSGHVSHPARRAPPHAATSGASIRCTTGRTARAIRSSGSRIPSARWSSRTIGRSTTGIWKRSAFTSRSRSSSPG